MPRKSRLESSPETAPPEMPPAPARPISKMEAVRRALAEGKDTPEAALPYIEEQFGLVMTKGYFSTYKSLINGPKKKEGRKRGRPPRRMIVGRATEAASDAAAEPREFRAVRQTHGDALDAARQVKGLCDAYGAETVKGLVELFGG